MKLLLKPEVDLIDWMGDDLKTVNAARVSFEKESEWGEDELGEPWLTEQDQKLVSYLARHDHWTPFAHNFVTFRIKAPIFVARQLVKHQVGLVWNEVSRRYVDSEPEFYMPPEWRGRPVNAKQGSSDVVIDPDQAEGNLNVAVTYHNKACIELYNFLLRSGVAPEQARMVLPLNAATEWIWSGSLVAFARVYKLRASKDAQKECSFVAKEMGRLIQPLFPVSWEELTK